MRLEFTASRIGHTYSTLRSALALRAIGSHGIDDICELISCRSRLADFFSMLTVVLS